MTVLTGFIYVIYFFVLGAGIRIAFNIFAQKQLIIVQKSEFIAHAFFQGVFFHIVLFNMLQLFDWSVSGLLFCVAMLILICTFLIAWQLRQGLIIKASNARHKQAAIVSLLVILGSIFIYWNTRLLPNIAWDSWAVWEGRAQQWIIHGLNVDIVRWDEPSSQLP